MFRARKGLLHNDAEMTLAFYKHNKGNGGEGAACRHCGFFSLSRLGWLYFCTGVSRLQLNIHILASFMNRTIDCIVAAS